MITASPVSAATAAVIGLLATHNIGLVQILLICVPSTLIAVFVAALLQLRIGKELRDDPEYQNRLASGEIGSVGAAVQGASTPLAWALSKKAKSKIIRGLHGSSARLATLTPGTGFSEGVILDNLRVRWLISQLTETEAPPPSAYSQLRALEWLVGNWEDKAGNQTVDAKVNWGR